MEAKVVERMEVVKVYKIELDSEEVSVIKNALGMYVHDYSGVASRAHIDVAEVIINKLDDVGGKK